MDEDIALRIRNMRTTINGGYNNKGIYLPGSMCKYVVDSLDKTRLYIDKLEITIEDLEERIAIMKEGGSG